jgi:hypothetical protein
MDFHSINDDFSGIQPISASPIGYIPASFQEYHLNSQHLSHLTARIVVMR